ncbi:Pimeloyl-ACP methyl ester carboxylesterase [Gulbenkiania indica]|uniref:Pimeloyl-ACP methyl ester carboxylesterase n=1 Tax=Gulbenkiania indica TaxID=375574 RepID=A0A0K6H4S6_9NEIS|nr:alpha/beta hydrolase [Gulbenkiania indica]CUA85984.1 Pimeloyl-ACP methyl ester carboxylesterase [Gulbenkiania indica]
MKDIIHFAHANSFPASVYRRMLEGLATRYRVGYLDTIGHDPAYPVTDCWPHLVDESIHYIERHYDRPVVAVGHSLGGYLMTYAALRRPELFRALVVLDSPLMGPFRSRAIWLAKRLGFIDRITPGGNTLKRRDRWASVEMVREYFARKPMFARFHPDCLSDYALQGTEPLAEGGRRLKFRPEVEYAIYRGLPHDLPRYRGQLKVPGLFIAGTATDVVRPDDLNFIAKHFGLRIVHQPGTHLFPLEQPDETARRILEGLDALFAGLAPACASANPVR